MTTDRGIDPAREAVALDNGFVKAFAHAMQPLELVPFRLATGEFDDLGNCQCVVGGELRVEHIPCRQHPLGAAQIGQIRRRFSREHRIAFRTAFLGVLDFRIPIGALYEAHHQFAVGLAGCVDQPVDHVNAALLIGLNRQSKAIPALGDRIGQHGCNDIQRDLQPVGFFSVDGEVEVVVLGHLRQFAQLRQEFVAHAPAVDGLIARMQRGKLHRNTRTVRQLLVTGGLADGGNRLGIGLEVTLRILLGARALAQHVIGIAIALRFLGPGAFQSLLDGFSKHELMTEQAHCLAGCHAHGRHAHALDEARQDRLRRVARVQQT